MTESLAKMWNARVNHRKIEGLESQVQNMVQRQDMCKMVQTRYNRFLIPTAMMLNVRTWSPQRFEGETRTCWVVIPGDRVDSWFWCHDSYEVRFRCKMLQDVRLWTMDDLCFVSYLPSSISKLQGRSHQWSCLRSLYFNRKLTKTIHFGGEHCHFLTCYSRIWKVFFGIFVGFRSLKKIPKCYPSQTPWINKIVLVFQGGSEYFLPPPPQKKARTIPGFFQWHQSFSSNSLGMIFFPDHRRIPSSGSKWRKCNGHFVLWAVVYGSWPDNSGVFQMGRDDGCRHMSSIF